MKTVNALGILERLSKALDVHSDVELAKHLGVATQTISTWKKRDKVPLDHIVEISIKNAFSLDSIIFGDAANNNISPMIKVADFAKGMSDMDLAEDVLSKLDEELLLTEQGLTGETLATILSAMGRVKRLIPGGLYISKNHEKELEDGVNNYLSSYYEIMYVARKNSEKFAKPEEEKSENRQKQLEKPSQEKNKITQKIAGTNHTIAGNDIKIER